MTYRKYGPPNELWLTPHCADCEDELGSYEDILWSADNEQDDCERCGRTSIRYTVDLRFLRKSEK